MFLAAFLIGLREGLEASLIIGILVAYVQKIGRPDAREPIWFGVTTAIVLTVGAGAIFTFGRYALTFRGQETLGGVLSLVAVAMVTWMVFYMMKAGVNMKASLESSSDQALLSGKATSMLWLSLITVGREGLEMTLMLWGWLTEPLALFGALSGIAIAVVLGALVYRQAVRIDYTKFFAWMGGFLIVVVAGILAYAVHDLQEAAVLPGPYSGAPITPTDVRTGEVLTGLTTNLFWLAAFPFGWAFDYSGVIAPDGFLGALLKGTVGFLPQMSWLEVSAWFVYMVIVFPKFVRLARSSARARKERRRKPPVGHEPASVSSPDGHTHSQLQPESQSLAAPDSAREVQGV